MRLSRSTVRSSTSIPHVSSETLWGQGHQTLFSCREGIGGGGIAPAAHNGSSDVADSKATSLRIVGFALLKQILKLPHSDTSVSAHCHRGI